MFDDTKSIAHSVLGALAAVPGHGLLIAILVIAFFVYELAESLTKHDKPLCDIVEFVTGFALMYAAVYA